MENQDLDIFKLEVDEAAKATMLEMSRWTKFLAIIGFIFIGLMLLFGIGMSIFYSSFYNNYGGAASMENISGATFLILMTFFAGIYFYPVFALLKYSAVIKVALRTADKTQFNKAIRYQKNMFKYLGIMMIIVLALYGLLIAISIISAAGKI